ncbi:MULTISPECIES: Bug family tripartite tricarboxylate transporter substrate binding protein [Chelativorans]|uniref:Bug family tripartite tricarboxylate transporter substrate binding protein n=1 Tax=Chelativorans intermedius TaxID=515947 RepID=A0ABV6DDC5_9HYPH|nr:MULTISPECIES: tripartite tricarboxylate transporter substrate binding protein [Chelativorans]MCT9000571.1 tripartite tricarboxylate transporter substrate binding protein [Chelativorans intermedius]WEX12185.1 tripartite tricarboxylate transporter substrate binding protein [Chelativorans sp. AA-79]
MNIFRSAAAVLAVAGLMTTAAGNALADYPEKPVKIIVPTDAGGAIDGIARIFQRAFEQDEEFGATVVVTNMPGAGGTLATREIKDADPDGYTIGLWHNGLVTSAAMGVTDFDHTAFDIIGSTGFVALGLGVNAESGPESFEAMLEQAQQEPESIKVAVNIGLPVHFIPLMVSEANGGNMRMVQAGGGAKRLSSVLGGHTHTALFSVQELVKYRESGLKPVVVFSEERVPQLPDVPTTREAGIDVLATDGRIWLAPKGVPEDRMQVLRAAFERAMEQPEVKDQLESYGITPAFIDSDAVTAELSRVRDEVLPLVEKVRAAAN